MYLQWNSFAPRTWKCATLRTILIRTYKICLTKELLQNELKHIGEEFIKLNGYPKWVFDQVKKNVRLLEMTMTTMLQRKIKALPQPTD